jgi:hypothetical protein
MSRIHVNNIRIEKTKKRYKFYNKLNTRKKIGAGITSSKPVYPPLPESPTNRPSLLVNNESLKSPKKYSNEYLKRVLPLAKRVRNARHISLINRILGREPKKPKSPKSYFKINNSGFKL